MQACIYRSNLTSQQWNHCWFYGIIYLVFWVFHYVSWYWFLFIYSAWALLSFLNLWFDDFYSVPENSQPLYLQIFSTPFFLSSPLVIQFYVIIPYCTLYVSNPIFFYFTYFYLSVLQSSDLTSSLLIFPSVVSNPLSNISSEFLIWVTEFFSSGSSFWLFQIHDVAFYSFLVMQMF